MRSIWKGHLQFSLVTIPIRVYNAVNTAERVQFNQLHDADNGRIGYTKRCKTCGEDVESAHIRKGFEYEPGQYVVIDDDDLANIRLKSTKIIALEGFVDIGEVPTTLFDSPYLAGPDGPVAAKTYTLFADALKAAGKLGVGRVVLRDREDAVLVGEQDGGLIFYKIRYPGTLRTMADIPQLQRQTPDAEQLKLASQLIQSMSTRLDRIPLKDRYQGALQDLITAKLEGKNIVTASDPIPQVVDIMTALKASIKQVEPKPRKAKNAA